MGKLSARQQMMVRKATRRRPPDPSEQPGELNIVPFLDVVVNLMLFLLATAATVAVARADAQLPSTCGTGCDRRPRGLELSVTVTDAGVFVATRDARLAPGCEDTGSGGPTVARGLRGHDFDALRACLARLAARHPEERAVILSADPEVPYQDLIGAMDAARGDADRPLFPDVQLSAGVR